MKTRTITLTQANDEGFDPEKFNFDIKNMSNVQVYRVLRVVELVKEGHLHYVKLEFNDGDVSDPEADPMIVGTISRFIEQSPQTGQAVSPKVMDTQWRVMWDNKLWRPLDDDAATILECFRGIDKDRMEAFKNKLVSEDFKRQLLGKFQPSGPWKKT
jgi:hypothetical protein